MTAPIEIKTIGHHDDYDNVAPVALGINATTRWMVNTPKDSLESPCLYPSGVLAGLGGGS